MSENGPMWGRQQVLSVFVDRVQVKADGRTIEVKSRLQR